MKTTKYYLTTFETIDGNYCTIANEKGETLKKLTIEETKRLIVEELQEQSLDSSIEINSGYGNFLTGKTKNMNRKVVVIAPLHPTFQNILSNFGMK